MADSLTLSWTAFKALKADLTATIYVLSLGANSASIKYKVWIVSPLAVYECLLLYANSSEITDYETNYASAAVAAESIDGAIGKADKTTSITSYPYVSSGSLYGDIRSLDVTMRRLPTISSSYNPTPSSAGAQGGWWRAEITTTSVSKATVLSIDLTPLSVGGNIREFWVQSWGIGRATSASAIGATKTLEYNNNGAITVLSKSLTNAAAGTDNWDIVLAYPMRISQTGPTSNQVSRVLLTVTPSGTTSTIWTAWLTGWFEPIGANT